MARSTPTTGTYGTLALYQIGGRGLEGLVQLADGAVLTTQRTDGNFEGSWDPVGVWGEVGGRVYSTALLCLTLECYFRYSRLVR